MDGTCNFFFLLGKQSPEKVICISYFVSINKRTKFNFQLQKMRIRNKHISANRQHYTYYGFHIVKWVKLHKLHVFFFQRNLLRRGNLLEDLSSSLVICNANKRMRRVNRSSFIVHRSDSRTIKVQFETVVYFT